MAQQNFRELVGEVDVKPVESQATTQVPYITWGGDVATFLANGGLKTQPNSIYGKQGLDLQLTAGDDFVGQVKNYLAGKTPFLRGTLHMMGLASEAIGADPRTKPVIIMQLSWSAGDHIVAREGIKSLNDLKGKKIACQQGGPHVGLLYDSLAAAKLEKSDVNIVWVNDLTGPDGPADAMRNDPSIDACCVITPDMIGLTGDFDSIGSGAEGTIEGAHVVNSTAQMSRSIADVYAVRKDWYDANRAWVEKFVSGYLKGTEELVAMRNEFEESQKMGDRYEQTLKMSQDIFGPDVVPTLEFDAHGLLLDCTFVGVPGQIAFFRDSKNLSGFDRKMAEALDLATSWGYAKSRAGFEPNNFDYKSLVELAGAKYVEPVEREGFNAVGEATDLFLGGNLDTNTIVSFTINFEPNQSEFSIDRYGAEFDRALQAASTFGNARVIIRGHSDPTKTLVDFVKAGMKAGVMKQSGSNGNYKYFFRGKPLDVTDTDAVIALIEKGELGGGNPDPVVTMQVAMNLSKKRAEAVRDTLIDYAKNKSVAVDVSQLTPVGAGVTEPIVAKPVSLAEAKENMRVEFRIVKVNAEALAPSDFDF
jgi:ABC-type nitrate/sulfonate/bicarbonate transport system substrate-binding protein/outer membrane protein OmpA-like peptidoglycan-associated protein